MSITVPYPGDRAVVQSVREIVLWGRSQVGKTTWLAACFSALMLEWLQLHDDRTAQTRAQLLALWNRLISNQLVSGTMAEQYYSVLHSSGAEIRFRDMRGENSQDPAQNQQDTTALRNASAALVFVEWPGRAEVKDSIAVNGALALTRRDPPLPVGLVVTKCENHLDSRSLARFASDPRRFASEGGVPRPLAELIERFETHTVFPLTVYGFAESGDRPAHFRDEFGRLVPWGIRPFLVGAPLEWAVEIAAAP